ncbi:ABC thiamine transporter, periplasmic substrate-binding protein [Pseudooceanicola batsensis HTCC2597]|uniref:ABC thiamine transporter, periplasmic substrate-binding protein n=1 Tax=Pseudooceanicola batsensis (strain ATCC BAA-863 / DSM 15984 / KCTC 12145 / HTCC2597) TaxID=252305 RepID=A3U3Y6_PSEBH|nr:thiamine ABC transporter substrate binding subunit [Pseudooceanicola batsensis]EAQ01122.1 ABC thiamine transporter, periplasmic substrate-binding protein [Pseudooceanicola batsensis HTCC2597]
MKHLIYATGLLFATQAVAQAPDLTVYTYDSFATEWGPGPAIEEGFEAQCGCDLEFVAAGDGAALLSRLRLEGDATRADVVLGLDTNLMAAARDTGLFAAHGVEADFALPVAWEDPDFLPFDWGYFAFIGNRGEPMPTDFRDLAESDRRILIQDPRSSTPGLGLLLWVKDAYGDEAAAIWEGLADNIVTVTPGWSEAYGMFLEGEGDLVLSYTTSPAYHVIAEDDTSRVALPFDEGHYMQIEVAAAVGGSDRQQLARDFLAYLVSDEAQSIIPTTNWMYPAVEPSGGLPEGFGDLVEPSQPRLIAPGDVPETRDVALEEWRAALSQ